MNTSSLARGLLLAAVLITAVLGAAIINVSAVGADPPIPGAGPLTLPAPTTPVAAPAAPLTLDRFEITEVSGTQATLIVRASAPTTLSYTVRSVDGADGGTSMPAGPVWVAEHRYRLQNLQSNATYEVEVTVIDYDSRLATASTRFTTTKERIRVTLREIDIEADGDLFGNGEPAWSAYLHWAGSSTGGCFPYNGIDCTYGSYPSGVIFPQNRGGQPLTWLFAEENFDTLPSTLTLSANAEEDDVSNAISWYANCFEPGTYGCGTGNIETARSWQKPQGVEWSSTPVKVIAYDEETGFRSILTFTFETFHDNLSYPSERNAPSASWK